MNVIASTGGVSAKTTVNMGGLSLASATVTSQGAIVNAQFNSGINNSGLTIENTGNTTVAAGVKTNTDESGEIRAEVLAKKAQAEQASNEKSEPERGKSHEKSEIVRLWNSTGHSVQERKRRL